MIDPGPHPQFWRMLVHLLGLLRSLLAATDPEAFTAISAEARARLAHLAAMVRRYIHILAAEVTLPPLGPIRPAPESQDARASRHTETFALIERPSVPGLSGNPQGEGDPPALQWALIWQAASRLSAVLRDLAPHAHRLARYRQRWRAPTLRDLPVRWSVLRRLGAAADASLNRLDQLARSEAWAGIDTS